MVHESYEGGKNDFLNYFIVACSLEQTKMKIKALHCRISWLFNMKWEAQLHMEN